MGTNKEQTKQQYPIQGVHILHSGCAQLVAGEVRFGGGSDGNKDQGSQLPLDTSRSLLDPSGSLSYRSPV